VPSQLQSRLAYYFRILIFVPKEFPYG
jgi:hypothetical protein